jgi:hypothetical protein
MDMKYSRENPSPRYHELQRLYRAMHETGEDFLGIPAEQTFLGKSLLPQARHIKRLIQQTGARTILDYGSGKGKQYDVRPFHDETVVWADIMEFWGVDEVTCYDPCYEPYSKLPEGGFDGVISTDVLEHCPEEDLSWIVDEIFGYADKFVFANVACYPAAKRLPNGENAHCTIRPAGWWDDLARQVAAKYPRLLWEFRIYSEESSPMGIRLVEQKIGNS